MSGTPSIAPSPYPCASCPYRRNAPSGVWAAEEYDKLPPYDAPTPFQPTGMFYCHQDNNKLCSGWVGCHDMDETLALRFASRMMSKDDLDAVFDYESPVPLFESGTEAAEHGKAEIPDPGPKARRAIDKLTARRERRGNAQT